MIDTRSGPIKRFTCSGCDTYAEGPQDGLPHGWHWQTSGRLGEIPRCDACALKNASRIATGRMSTEEILNAGKDGAEVDAITDAAQSRLRSFFQRVNNLLDEMEERGEDIKEVKAEAKGEGYDIKVLMAVIRESRKDPVKRKEFQAMFELYATALGEDL